MTLIAPSALAMGVIAQASAGNFLASPVCWGLFIAAFGMWAMLTGRSEVARRPGRICGGLGLVVLGYGLFRVAPLANWTEQTVFWLLSAVAVGGAAAAVVSRSPVYTAIWFAYSLLGVAGLFVQQQAAFLGVATIVVYAGAIIVTFLFVLMLAQPRGHSSYDQISWATLSMTAAVIAATALAATVLASFPGGPINGGSGAGGLTEPNHMARFGAELFSRHLIAVEVAGTLLLLALVGAIAIVIHGRSPVQPGPHDSVGAER